MCGFAAAVVTGTQSANVVGSPGQAALASAINNGQGVPPGSPIASESSAFATNAPAFASSISGRKLKQVHQLDITAFSDSKEIVLLPRNAFASPLSQIVGEAIFALHRSCPC